MNEKRRSDRPLAQLQPVHGDKQHRHGQGPEGAGYNADCLHQRAAAAGAKLFAPCLLYTSYKGDDITFTQLAHIV